MSNLFCDVMYVVCYRGTYTLAIDVSKYMTCIQFSRKCAMVGGRVPATAEHTLDPPFLLIVMLLLVISYFPFTSPPLV